MAVVFIGQAAKTMFSCAPHSHHAWEIVCNTAGCGTTKIGDKTYEFHPGSIICIPPEYSHEKHSEEGFLDIYLHADMFVLGSKYMYEPCFFEDNAEKDFSGLLRIAHKAFAEKSPNYQALTESIWSAMCQLLVMWSSSSGINPVVAKVKNEIINRYTDPDFAAADAMNTGSYNSNYVSSEFKKELGETPARYLMKLRIDNARTMLLSMNYTQFKIADIALMSGFRDPQYFSRVFKQATGKAPGEFAEEHEKSLMSSDNCC